jgi:hypothetical protein
VRNVFAADEALLEGEAHVDRALGGEKTHFVALAPKQILRSVTTFI